MKTFLLSITLSSITLVSFAQIPVSTTPTNKNVLLEEHTGVDCNSCPNGHQEIQNLINTYPNRVYAAGMHAYSTGHTTPYTPQEEDLRRQFPDDLRTKIPDMSGIPSGIISRRAKPWGKESHIFWIYSPYHQSIDTLVNTVLAEPSPFNIGVVANYDSVNKILEVKTQVYATSAANGTYKINVYFTQSNIFVTQLNGSTYIPNYNEKHVFRELITPTWGAVLFPSGASQTDIKNNTFIFNNSTRNYKMQDVEVLVFITEHPSTANEKGHVVTVKGMHPTIVNGGTTSIDDIANNNSISIYPNPSTNQVYVHLTNPSLNNEVFVSDINGKVVFRKQVSNENNFYFNHELAPGVYFLSVKNNPGLVQKLIVQ